MKKIICALIIVIISALPVLALELPYGSKNDGRIKFVKYREDDVTRINCFVGIGTLIVFGKDETVMEYGGGYSDAWEMVPRRNTFWLKPKLEDGDTNLHIITNKHIYAFELQFHKNWKKDPNTKIALAYDKKMDFRVQFVYPGDAAEKKLADAANEEIKRRLASPNRPKNWNYTMHVGPHSREIAPSRAYDDGLFTYLRFPNNRDVPAIFAVSADGSESLVNLHVIDDLDIIVIQRVSREYMLRLGDMVVGLYNESYDSDGPERKGGTTKKGLKRVIKVGK